MTKYYVCKKVGEPYFMSMPNSNLEDCETILNRLAKEYDCEIEIKAVTLEDDLEPEPVIPQMPFDLFSYTIRVSKLNDYKLKYNSESLKLISGSVELVNPFDIQWTVVDENTVDLVVTALNGFFYETVMDYLSEFTFQQIVDIINSDTNNLLDKEQFFVKMCKKDNNWFLHLAFELNEPRPPFDIVLDVDEKHFLITKENLVELNKNQIQCVADLYKQMNSRTTVTVDLENKTVTKTVQISDKTDYMLNVKDKSSYLFEHISSNKLEQLLQLLQTAVDTSPEIFDDEDWATEMIRYNSYHVYKLFVISEDGSYETLTKVKGTSSDFPAVAKKATLYFRAEAINADDLENRILELAQKIKEVNHCDITATVCVSDNVTGTYGYYFNEELGTEMLVVTRNLRSRRRPYGFLCRYGNGELVDCDDLYFYNDSSLSHYLKVRNKDKEGDSLLWIDSTHQNTLNWLKQNYDVSVLIESADQSTVEMIDFLRSKFHVVTDLEQKYNKVHFGNSIDAVVCEVEKEADVTFFGSSSSMTIHSKEGLSHVDIYNLFKCTRWRSNLKVKLEVNKCLQNKWLQLEPLTTVDESVTNIIVEINDGKQYLCTIKNPTVAEELCGKFKWLDVGREESFYSVKDMELYQKQFLFNTLQNSSTSQLEEKQNVEKLYSMLDLFKKH